MNRRILVVGLILMAVSLAGLVGIAVAQEAAVPTVEKPLVDDPFGLEAALEAIRQGFSAGWYVGLALCIFVFVNILRGKLKIKGVVFRVPWLSDKFDKLAKVWKLVIISGGITVAMGFYGLTKVVEWEFVEILRCFGSGALSGLMLALMANGLNDAKRSIDDARKKE